MNREALALTAYLLVAVVSFGHSASHNAECELKARDVTKCSAGAGLAAGILWPFYLSWAAFDAMAAEGEE